MATPKILYAASNRLGARHQLTRFFAHLAPRYKIKKAGYKRMGLNLDWTLDALSDIVRPEYTALNNDNFEILFDQIKSFDPDLIISDMEPFVSYAGQLLNKPIWQVSPLLLEHCDYTSLGMNIGITKYELLYPLNFIQQLTANTIINADRKMIYSHLMDVETPPILPDTFEWVRPYYRAGEVSVPCQHQIMVASHTAKIVKSLQAQYNSETVKEAVIFSPTPLTQPTGFMDKDIDNASEYACNLKNCQYLISDGSTDTVADAFYNQQYCLIIPELFEKESIFNMLFANHYGYGKTLYNGKLPRQLKKINHSFVEETTFLHQQIDQFFG